MGSAAGACNGAEASRDTFVTQKQRDLEGTGEKATGEFRLRQPCSDDARLSTKPRETARSLYTQGISTSGTACLASAPSKVGVGYRSPRPHRFVQLMMK